jgi:hypothetical protein
MFGIELMRLLGGGKVELETYRMRNGNVLVLVEHKKEEMLEVTIYNRSDIEERTWQFFDKDEAQKKFNEVKAHDRLPVDPKTGAKR